MFKLAVYGDKELAGKFKRISEQIPEKINQSLVQAGMLVASWSRTQYLSGQVLHVRTDLLRGSVRESKPYRSGNAYNIKVGTPVFYGAIWEKGHPKYGQKQFLAPAVKDKEKDVREKISKDIMDLFK